MNISKITEILSKKNIKLSIILVAISSLLGFIYNSLLPDSLPFIYHKKITETVNDSLLFGENLNSISPTDFKSNLKTPDTTNIEKTSTKADIKDTSKAISANDMYRKSNEQAIIKTAPANDFLTVSFDQIQRIINSSDFIIIDARNPEQFSKGHIPNSINIFALDPPDVKVPKIFEIPQGKKIVVYCDGGNCDLSHELAKELKSAFGFTQVFVYEGGWEEWAKKIKK